MLVVTDWSVLGALSDVDQVPTRKSLVSVQYVTSFDVSCTSLQYSNTHLGFSSCF